MPGSCMNDTNCIALNLVGGKLQASLTIDPDPTNGALCRANGLYVASPTTDWLPETVAWSYVSTTSFTAPGDLTSRYVVGRRLSFLDVGVQKYAYVISSSYSGGTNLTTVNVIVATTVGAASTLSGGALTVPAYSKIEDPYGFPSFFLYTPAYTGWVATPDFSNTKISISGRQMTFSYYVYGTGSGASRTLTLPIAAAGVVYSAMSVCMDNTAYINTSGNQSKTAIGSTTLTLYKMNDVIWINGGVCNLQGQTVIPI